MRSQRGFGKIVRALCTGVCFLVLGAFCLQVGKGVGRVRRGEATPAQVIEDTVDWLMGNEERSLG